jgi:hypothetical protein
MNAGQPFVGYERYDVTRIVRTGNDAKQPG